MDQLKLLRLTFENLHEVQGPVCLDFTSQPFILAPIPLETLVDALTLALLGEPDDVASSPDAFAEVELSKDSVRYRAGWFRQSGQPPRRLLTQRSGEHDDGLSLDQLGDASFASTLGPFTRSEFRHAVVLDPSAFAALLGDPEVRAKKSTLTRLREELAWRRGAHVDALRRFELQKRSFDQLSALRVEIPGAEAALDAAKTSVKESSKGLSSITRSLHTLESTLAALREREVRRQADLDAFQQILSLAVKRTQLVSNAPCPLCGSVTHPYLDDDGLEARIEEHRRALTADIAEGLRAHTRLEEEIARLAERRNTAEIRHERVVAELGSLDPQGANALDAARMEVEEQAKAVLALQLEHDTLQDEISDSEAPPATQRMAPIDLLLVEATGIEDLDHTLNVLEGVVRSGRRLVLFAGSGALPPTRNVFDSTIGNRLRERLDVVGPPSVSFDSSRVYRDGK